jgi:hypothetical protein
VFWTTMEIDERYVSELRLPTQSIRKRNRYGFSSRDFDGVNRFMPISDWDKRNAERRNAQDYLDFLKKLRYEFVILLSKEDNVVNLFGRLLRNCLIADGSKVHQGNSEHTYFLPLHFHAALTDWLKDIYDDFHGTWNINRNQQQDKEDELAITFKGHQAYVQGVKWDQQEAYCLACPFILDRTLRVCHPMYVDCKRSEPPFTVLPKLDDETGGNSFKELEQWYLNNPMDVEALRCPEVESICKYEEAKKISSHGAFECVSLQSLTDDEQALKQLHDQRSERSSDAARTRKMKGTVCDGCLKEEDEYGCKRSCTGPWYGVDYLHLAEKCEPWMVWALELSLYDRTFDFRKVIPELRGDRIQDHDLVPYSDGRMMVMKKTRRETSGYDVPFSLVHSIVSEQSKIKFPADDNGAFYETWEELENSVSNLRRYSYWPPPEWVKVLAYMLSTHSLMHRMRIRAGFGYVCYVLSSLELRSTSIFLNYSKGARSSYSKVASLDDFYQFKAVKEHTDERKEENKFLHKLVLEDNVLIPGRCFRHVVETRNWRELSIKDWKKLLKAAGRKVGKKTSYGHSHYAGLLLEAFKNEDAKPSD